VLKGDKSGYFVCIIPGAAELDLKAAAKVSGNKSCEMIPMKELLNITGYIRGACSPLGMKKQFPTYIDDSYKSFDNIYVSAGKRGLQIQLNPLDLIQIVNIKSSILIKSDF
jgi:Cys-tRNA(Pro)/Cys-tRNA(Cys) deacylase